MVAQVDGLGTLQVGVTGHRPVEVTLRDTDLEGVNRADECRADECHEWRPRRFAVHLARSPNTIEVPS